MTFELDISAEAKEQLAKLKKNSDLEKRYKAVAKALNYLKTNPRHPGLNVHPFDSMSGPGGAKVWEAYAENNTPRAYRIFFSYGPKKQMIRIIAILPHPA